MLATWLFRLLCLCLIAMVCALAALRIGGGENLALFSFALLAIVSAAALAMVAALATLLFVLRKKPVSTYLLSVIVGGLLPLTAIISLVGEGFNAPSIHDISTDLTNPPVFAFAAADRKVTSNSLQVDLRVLATQQLSYPEIKPLFLAVTEGQAIEAVEAVGKQLGWLLLGRSSSPYQIEFVDQTALLGFKDDIAVRITTTAFGTRIDIRSASRIGQSDFGTNALRVVMLLTAIEEQSKSVGNRLDSRWRAS